MAVELDGTPWRTLPVDVAAAAGLRAGVELDRPRLRELARALRRRSALDAAVRALRRRDFSSRTLDDRLARGGVRGAARRDALETLERTGVVDDQRFALARAAALAERGYGDDAIRCELRRQGITPETTGRALASLAPEPERAAAVVERRGTGPKTAAYLARRGFGEDVVEAALGGGT